MAHINLLPWRENLRKQKANEFYALAGMLLLATAIAMYGWHWTVNDQINHQSKRNNFIKEEISLVENKIREIKDLEKTRSQLLARMDVIQQLQSSRPEIVHLFDELVTTLPDGIVLTSIKQSGKKISVNGKAQSNARVSSYMRSIEDSKWLGKTKLEIIRNSSKESKSEFNAFSLEMTQTTHTASKEEETEK